MMKTGTAAPVFARKLFDLLASTLLVPVGRAPVVLFDVPVSESAVPTVRVAADEGATMMVEGLDTMDVFDVTDEEEGRVEELDERVDDDDDEVVTTEDVEDVVEATDEEVCCVVRTTEDDDDEVTIFEAELDVATLFVDEVGAEVFTEVVGVEVGLLEVVGGVAWVLVDVVEQGSRSRMPQFGPDAWRSTRSRCWSKRLCSWRAARERVERERIVRMLERIVGRAGRPRGEERGK